MDSQEGYRQRRMLQNRLAQRRFRERNRAAKSDRSQGEIEGITHYDHYPQLHHSPGASSPNHLRGDSNNDSNSSSNLLSEPPPPPPLNLHGEGDAELCSCWSRRSAAAASSLLEAKKSSPGFPRDRGYHHHLPQVNEEAIQLSNFLFPTATNKDNNNNNTDTPLSLHIHHGQLLQAEHALATVQKQRDRLGAQGRALLRQLSEVYAIGVSLDIFIASEAFQVHLLGAERAFAALSE
ncbi:uncharacterized protein BO95DRAFT_198213 [Aspergillus brunneoviolaceus CBS 621.78]|uniref:Uncharacterized protein n=1 Tax=Aspergillus brunneoviolaceus CBS 621.78 TaxID=1450534 RepID=A0ACD1GLX9_9EURO|nr:hypothetical protein BO95DRAFT_198213 [Aspergillus brunneoviolaceus CBS 621.78]RAH50354.1 hypothetical protein BO95DRAFT_198213 [Aspergillus brunneoviolaceus CBS 621.78]